MRVLHAAGNNESEGVFRFAGYQREVEDILSAKAYLEGRQQQVVALVGKWRSVAILWSSGSSIIFLSMSHLHQNAYPFLEVG